jgi:acyl transferase domain-containing protein/acyl carrier protein
MPMFSTVTGHALEAGEGDAAYWGRNVRQPVVFAAAVAECLAREQDGFLEIGPHPVLSGAIAACLAAHGRMGVVVASLRRKQPERVAMLSALGTLYTHGFAVEWRKQHPAGGRCVQLPAYPWQRGRYWLPVQTSRSIQRAPMVGGDWQNWLYELAWQLGEQKEDLGAEPAGRVGTNALRGGGTWLILADGRGVGECLAALLSSRGATCVLASAGPRYERDASGRFVLNAANADDARRMVEELAATGISLQGVVHLWSLDDDAVDEQNTSEFPLDTAGGCRSVLWLLQVVASVTGAVQPRVWVVTHGVQVVGPTDKPSLVAGAQLWGMGRVAAREHPEIWGGLVDLEEGEDPSVSASVLCRELLGSHDEDQVVVRAGRRYVARLRRVRLHAERKVDYALRGDASYLVTGGLGGLGLTVAEWMVRRGARHLVLVGRREPSSVAQGRIVRMEQSKATVVVLSADIAKSDDVVRVLSHIRQTLPPLRGIVHAAGIFDDRVLLRHDWERFERVLRPKVQGAWNLHRLTVGLPLDFFVLFSSVAALLGLSGLSNYSAANAFLGMLAQYRKGRGLPALSIDWGIWDRLGMADAVGEDRRRQWHMIGLDAMPPDQALEVLEQLLSSWTGSTVGVQPITWPRFLDLLDSGRVPPLLMQVAQGVDVPARAQSPLPAGSAILGELEAAAPSDRPQILLTHVREQALRILGVDPSRPLEPHHRFFEVGMDSLMAVELKNRLQTTLGCALPATVVFDYPSVGDLSTYLYSQVLRMAVQKPTCAAIEPRTAEPVRGQEELSEEELTSMLAERLKRLG